MTKWLVIAPLELEFRRIIDDPRDSFQIVRFHPTNLPVVAMLGSEAKLYKELEETREDVVMPDSIRKLVGRVLEETPSIPIIFYINADNPIIQRVINLDLRTEIVVISLRAICSNAIFLAAGRLPKNSVEMMFHDFTRVIDFLLNQTTELEQTRTWLSKAQLALEETEQKESPAELTSHVSCFVAMPFGQEYDYIFMALRQLLEDRPYYWQVIRADERQFEATISGNVHQHIARGHTATSWRFPKTISMLDWNWDGYKTTKAGRLFYYEKKTHRKCLRISRVQFTFHTRRHTNSVQPSWSSFFGGN